MEKRTNELLQQAEEIMGQDVDLLILAHKDGQCGAVIHGNADKIAEAIFSCMHQPNNPIGQALYGIIKQNMANILGNPSSFAVDLLKTINDVLPDENE